MGHVMRESGTQESIANAISFCKKSKIELPADASVVLKSAEQLRHEIQNKAMIREANGGSVLLQKLNEWKQFQESVGSPHVNTVLWVALFDDLSTLAHHKSHIERDGHKLTFDIPETALESRQGLQAQCLTQLINELSRLD